MKSKWMEQRVDDVTSGREERRERRDNAREKKRKVREYR